MGKSTIYYRVSIAVVEERDDEGLGLLRQPLW